MTGWRCTRAPLCFVLFCGCSVWNFHLVGLLRSSPYQTAAALPSVFYNVLCIEPSASAIQFASYLFLARVRRRLSTGTGVCQW